MNEPFNNHLQHDNSQYTTPPPCIKIIDIFPNLIAKQKTAVRLHPRSFLNFGPEVGTSHLGGQMLWSSAQPRPFCELHKQSYSPVFQFLRRDFPEIPFPGNTDLLQMLCCPSTACPNGLMEEYLIKWGHCHEANFSIGDHTVERKIQPSLIFYSCILHPERINEYPQAELTDSERKNIENWMPEMNEEMRTRQQEFFARSKRKYSGGRLYDQELSVAHGSKIGGYLAWHDWPTWLLPTASDSVLCPLGHKMELLVTIAGSQWTFGGRRRWRPIEDSDYEVPSQDPMSPFRIASWSEYIYIMICRTCNPWSTRCIVI